MGVFHLLFPFLLVLAQLGFAWVCRWCWFVFVLGHTQREERRETRRMAFKPDEKEGSEDRVFKTKVVCPLCVLCDLLSCVKKVLGKEGRLLLVLLSSGLCEQEGKRKK